jgi:hypothetical protein
MQNPAENKDSKADNQHIYWVHFKLSHNQKTVVA